MRSHRPPTVQHPRTSWVLLVALGVFLFVAAISLNNEKLVQLGLFFTRFRASASWVLIAVSDGASSDHQNRPIPMLEVKRKYLQPRTLKFAAEDDDNVLNIHVVPHTHDDVGWLKTVEQYYYGQNNTIQPAAVKYILSSLVDALLHNPNRTFTYVEQKFFSMWWGEQSEETKDTVKMFVADGQLSFANGGWCMHDEATSHFMGMIDQTTLGHSFLKKELGVIPRVGWQLDPFGHSATQASLLTSKLGFDGLFFGRIDYQDLRLRHETQECEGLWSSSPNLGDTIFWGLTGSYMGNYGAPKGFCFDVNCDDEPLVGDSDERLLQRVIEFVDTLKVQSDRTKGNHIMLTMGSDFQYGQALVNYANLDLLMNSILKYQESATIDVPSLFGPRFTRLAVFYSTPEYYLEKKNEETRSNHNYATFELRRSDERNAKLTQSWSIKKDDFFPYSDCEHCFWTGYFTSRTGFKRLERVGSSILQAARQIEAMRDSETAVGLSECKCKDPLFPLDDAMGVSQHHDAVSGTAKQHVANDYAKRVQAGIDTSVKFVTKKLRSLLLEASNLELYLEDLTLCQLLNETSCPVSEDATKGGDKDLYVIVYNGLAASRGSIISLPVFTKGHYVVKQIMNDREPHDTNGSVQQHVQTMDTTTSDSINAEKQVLYFDTGPLPPIGASVFHISLATEGGMQKDRAELGSTSSAKRRVVSNGILSVHFNCATGMIEHISNSADGSSLSLSQEWGFYTSFDSRIHQSPDGLLQNSGAYIFRPSTPDQELQKIGPAAGEAIFEETDVGYIVRTKFEQPWITQVTRVFNGQPFVEIEYTIGPIPIDDGMGKEIVTRFSTPIQTGGNFFTDSNGREFQERKRSHRPTWNLTSFEPVAGNYYPVNAAIYIEDETSSMAVVVDRTQGGASLQDGSIELMVQRRTLADDARGVNEAMNETVGGVSPYPPYGNAIRIGEGVIIRGKHRLLIGKGASGASIARSEMDNSFSEPLVFVASAPSGSVVPFRKAAFSGLQFALPKNVMLVTFQLLHDAPETTFLIRLGHQYAQGEDDTLSQAVRIDMGQLFVGYEILSLVEKTLSGNQDYSVWMKRRMDWTRDVRRIAAVADESTDYVVELKPMEIRTFELRAKEI